MKTSEIIRYKIWTSHDQHICADYYRRMIVKDQWFDIRNSLFQKIVNQQGIFDDILISIKDQIFELLNNPSIRNQIEIDNEIKERQ